MPYQRRPTAGGGLTEIGIKLDLEDQSPGFVNLTEIDTLNVTIADGGEPPSPMVAPYYYVEAGPVQNLHFIFLGDIARFIWVDCEDSPDLDQITADSSWAGSALYVEAWQQGSFTHIQDCPMDMQHSPLLTNMVFTLSTIHITARDCPNLATVDLTALSQITWWDMPDCNFNTANVDAIIAKAVAGAQNGGRLWLMGNASPTMSSPTAAVWTITFQNLPMGDGNSFIIGGRIFGENINVGGPGFDSGYAYAVNTAASEDPAVVAAAYAAVIEANGFAVTDNMDGTIVVTHDTPGPMSHFNVSGNYDVVLTTPGEGNANLTALIDNQFWNVGY